MMHMVKQYLAWAFHNIISDSLETKHVRSEDTYIIANQDCWFGFFCSLAYTLFAFDGKLPRTFIFPCILISRIGGLDMSRVSTINIYENTSQVIGMHWYHEIGYSHQIWQRNPLCINLVRYAKTWGTYIMMTGAIVSAFTGVIHYWQCGTCFRLQFAFKASAATQLESTKWKCIKVMNLYKIPK